VTATAAVNKKGAEFSEMIPGALENIPSPVVVTGAKYAILRLIMSYPADSDLERTLGPRIVRRNKQTNPSTTCLQESDNDSGSEESDSSNL
jgi:hypothetical protein